VFVDRVDGDRKVKRVVKDDLLPLIPPIPPRPNDPPLFSRPVVLSAFEVVGPYRAFVHVWAPPGRLWDLQRFIDGALWDRGVRGDVAVQATSHQGPDRVHGLLGTASGVTGVARIWVKRGRGGDVLTRVAGFPGFHGAAAVFGDADVVLVLKGRDFARVARSALALQAVAGVTRVETAFAGRRRRGKERGGKRNDRDRSA
jgi:hypothetical protein